MFKIIKQYILLRFPKLMRMTNLNKNKIKLKHFISKLVSAHLLMLTSDIEIGIDYVISFTNIYAVQSVMRFINPICKNQSDGC